MKLIIRPIEGTGEGTEICYDTLNTPLHRPTLNSIAPYLKPFVNHWIEVNIIKGKRFMCTKLNSSTITFKDLKESSNRPEACREILDQALDKREKTFKVGRYYDLRIRLLTQKELQALNIVTKEATNDK